MAYARVVLLGAWLPGVSADCSCKFQDGVLPEDLYTTYPLEDPGKHANEVAKGRYGSMCAAWDEMPGTPWVDEYCTGDNLTTNSWCRAPWCYVDESCASSEPTAVFAGSSTAFFSYAACGAPDCFTDPPEEGCPYGNVYKSDCPCRFQGQVLPTDLLDQHPYTEPGKYKDLKGIEYYGTSCGAWDQQPDTPYFDSCPPGSAWCEEAFNWCQAPWCYVDDSCASAENTTIFHGYELHYSYVTCGATDCYNDFSNDGCPWDGSGNSWYTAADCSSDSDSTTMVADATTMVADDSKAASALALSCVITASLIMKVVV